MHRPAGHSSELEGVPVTDGFLADARDCIDGETDEIGSLVARVGLEPGADSPSAVLPPSACSLSVCVCVLFDGCAVS